MMDKQGGHRYATPTWWKHLVAEYTGLNFLQVGELNYVEFLQYRRDAFIAMLSKTDKGQEYLDNSWRLEQIEPDRAALRRRFKK